MNWLGHKTKAEDAALETQMDEQELLDPALRQTLGAFKDSVHAWSEAELSKPRMVRSVSQHRRRVLVGWGLAAALLIGTGGTGVYEYHQHQAAVLAAQQQLRQQEAAEKARLKAQREEELFASVDSAVSREVPRAMEPLAMLADGTEGNQ